MDMSEKGFQRWVRGKLTCWSSSVEYGQGGDEGFPDMLLMVPPSMRLVPVELKVAKVKGELLFPESIRPAQMIWHRELARAGDGARSAFLFGVPVPELESWAVYYCDDVDLMVNWRTGLLVGTEVNLSSPEAVIEELYELLGDLW